MRRFSSFLDFVDGLFAYRSVPMYDVIGIIIGLLVLALLLATLVVPVVALVVSVRTRKKLNESVLRANGSQSATAPAELVEQLTLRVARLEAAIGAQPIERAEAVEEGIKPVAEPRVEPVFIPPSATPPATEPQAPPIPHPTIHAADLESIIGRRWLGWVSVALILFAAAFFLKYAFDNRWIGELGRVAIGVAAGITLTALGFRYHQRRWRVFSQILTGGGIVLLYLSVYASFGYYHLATQKAAFAYMAILIAEAAGLAWFYNAPAIAVMALLGGFLAPVLLRSDRDQYQSLFSYIVGLDIGALALLKHWWGLSSTAFVGTHLLFWLWYADNYHPRKLSAVIIFHTAVFLVFLLTHLARRLFRFDAAIFEDPGLLNRKPLEFLSNFEDLYLLLINPFVYFATAYHFLNSDHHDWMGAFAIGMALVYAAAAKLLLDRAATTRTELLLMIGIALTFVTLAIPIHLESNWITMAWALEALVILWAGFETKSRRLLIMAYALLALTVLRLVFWDTPFDHRPMFTPVLNKYFLSSLFVTACLFAAAFICHRFGERKQMSSGILQFVILIVALLTLWFVMTIETYTYFAARAAAHKIAEDMHHELWLGQMALSVLWSIYAAVLMAAGFLRRAAAIRWLALALFAMTVVKVMLVDISALKQLYRIIAFLVLGVLLLVVAWGYHKAFYSKESSA